MGSNFDIFLITSESWKTNNGNCNNSYRWLCI